MRKADAFLLFMSACLVLLILMFGHARFRAEASITKISQLSRVVRHLGLTDLCLATDARYTRHPSQADWHSAFQSHPLALDHFPSGSLIRPPQRLRKAHANMD